MNNIYKVTINNWTKHNPKHKATYKKFMFYNGFFSDTNVAQLKPTEVVVFIYLLCVTAESTSHQCTIHVKSLPKQFRISAKSLQTIMSRLESLQLVTLEIQAIIEENRIEKKIKEMKRSSDEVEHPPSPAPKSELFFDPPKDLGPSKKVITERNRKIWESYRSAYLMRYKVEPVRNLTVNTQIANIGKRIGHERAVDLVEFFLSHNDSYYVKTQHTIGACLKDCESLHTQMLRNKPITGAAARNFEKNHEGVSQSEMFRRLGEQAGNS